MRSEDQARRRAKRIGLIAKKTCRRANSVDNHGGFMLIEPERNIIIAGDRFDLSAEQVLELCKHWEGGGL